MKCTKRGPRPPLLGKKGAPANFLRGSRQFFDTEKMTGMVSPWYATLLVSNKDLKLRESLTFVTLPETTVTSNKSYSYLHWVTIDND